MGQPFRFRFCGEVLEPHPSGALYWPDQEVLVVADLHLEKGASLASTGQLLPPYDTLQTLEWLDDCLEHFRPKTLIALGDSFHDARVAMHLQPSVRARIGLLSQRQNLVWIAGNHDPQIPTNLGGTIASDLDLGALHFRHEASPLFPKSGEISGHFHPKATTLIKGHRYSRPVFVTDAKRLILPAFGAFTGGMWVHHPAIYNLFDHQIQVFFCAKNRVLPVSIDRILPKR